MLAKIINRRLLAHRNTLYFFSKDPFDKFNRKKDTKPNDNPKPKETEKPNPFRNEKSSRSRLEEEHQAPTQPQQHEQKQQEEGQRPTGFSRFGYRTPRSNKSRGEQKKEVENTKESDKSAVNHEPSQEENSPDEHEKEDEQGRSSFKEENESSPGKGFQRFSRKKGSPPKEKQKLRRPQDSKKQAQQSIQTPKQKQKPHESKRFDIPKISIDLNSDKNDGIPILRKPKSLNARQQKQQDNRPSEPEKNQQSTQPNNQSNPNKIWQQFEHEKEKFKASYKKQVPRYQRLNLFKQSNEKKPEKSAQPVNHKKNFTRLIIAGLGLVFLSKNQYFKWNKGTQVDPQYLKQAIDEERVEETWIQQTESDLHNEESIKGKSLKKFIYIREKNGEIYYCVSNHEFEQIWFSLVEIHNQMLDRKAPESFPVTGPTGMMPEVKHKIIIRPKQQDKNSSLVGDTRSMLSMVLFYFFIKSIMEVGKGAKGKGKGVSGLFQNQKSHRFKEVIKVTFQDVVGMQKSKDEIVQFIDFLKHPQKYNKLGARIPKGALLTGPPGTGKTMIAKACAGQSKVPFFTISGSEFIEMYVGVGAQRVRNLFKEAKENAPSIIFIDEIDAVGKKRSGMGGGGNDERDTTLNQLLVEMDGFDTNTNVIVFAATNQKEVLDPALTRPGRFDRLIEVDLPDLQGRREIFEVHLKPLVLDGHVNIKDYAKRLATLTPGFSGADIKNVCNQAAIIAARNNKEHVSIIDFQLATERIIGGVQKRSQLITPETRKTVAYHECGHGVVSWFIQNANPLLKLTIIPRSKGALGFAQYLPNQHQMYTKNKLLDEICVILGGRISEEVFFGKISTGASDDLNKAYQIAKAFVTQYGFGDKLGWIQYGETEYAKEYSKQIENKIDVEILQIMRVCSERTRTIVHEKRELIHRLAEKLLELETIDQNIIAAILGERPFKMSKQHEEYIKEKKRISEEVAVLTQQQLSPEKGQQGQAAMKRNDWVL